MLSPPPNANLHPALALECLPDLQQPRIRAGCPEQLASRRGPRHASHFTGAHDLRDLTPAGIVLSKRWQYSGTERLISPVLAPAAPGSKLVSLCEAFKMANSAGLSSSLPSSSVPPDRRLLYRAFMEEQRRHLQLLPGFQELPLPPAMAAQASSKLVPAPRTTHSRDIQLSLTSSSSAPGIELSGDPSSRAWAPNGDQMWHRDAGSLPLMAPSAFSACQLDSPEGPWRAEAGAAEGSGAADKIHEARSAAGYRGPVERSAAGSGGREGEAPITGHALSSGRMRAVPRNGPLAEANATKAEDKGGEARITPAVHSWLFRTASLRRVRFTYFDGGTAVQAFNSLCYPQDWLDAPLLGVDLLSFGPRKLLCVVDMQPVTSTHHRLERVSQALQGLLEVHPQRQSLFQGVSQRFFQDLRFFSPHLLLMRSEEGWNEPMLQAPSGALFAVFCQYLSLYQELLSSCPVLHDHKRRQAVRRGQSEYDAYFASADPAIPMFATYFGQEWADEYTQKFLFPWAKSVPAASDKRSTGDSLA